MTIDIPESQGPEKSILSSMLKDGRFVARAKADGITPEHFNFPARRTLFTAILERHSAGLDCELVAFVDSLHKSGRLDEIGGPAALHEVYSYSPNGAHWDAHVAILREQLAFRIAKTQALEIVQLPADTSPHDAAKRLRDALDASTRALTFDSGIIPARRAAAQLDALLAQLCSSDKSPGIETGLDPIDIVTGGMRGGELWVVAAEPSGGKSVVLLQAAACALREGKKVLVISLEMSAATVLSRVLTNLHSVPFQTFTDPRRAGKGYLQRAKLALNAALELPLSIHEQGGLTLEQIAGIAQVEADNNGLDLLIVDYLQLVESSSARRGDNREQQVAAISRGLKALSKRLNIPVFTASQLNDDGRLRESRAIGQDADVVLKIKDDGIKGVKVRNGVKDQLFPLFLNGEYQRFEKR